MFCVFFMIRMSSIKHNWEDNTNDGKCKSISIYRQSIACRSTSWLTDLLERLDASSSLASQSTQSHIQEQGQKENYTPSSNDI